MKADIITSTQLSLISVVVVVEVVVVLVVVVVVVLVVVLVVVVVGSSIETEFFVKFSVRLLWSYRNHIEHLEIFASDNLVTNSSQGCSQQSTFLLFEENTQIDLKIIVH